MTITRVLTRAMTHRGTVRGTTDFEERLPTLLEQAIEYLGIEPLHYWDFTQNRALFSGVDVGPVASTPGWSAASLTLSSSGMLMDGVSTPVITSPAITLPATLWVEIERVTDTGAAESIIQADENSNNESINLRVSATDLASAVMTDGGVLQANCTVAGAVATATVYRVAGRFNTNSVQVCRSGTLGTEDVAGTLPATPTHLRFGRRQDGTQQFQGYIRRAAVFSSALSDAQLQAIAFA